MHQQRRVALAAAVVGLLLSAGGLAALSSDAQSNEQPLDSAITACLVQSKTEQARGEGATTIEALTQDQECLKQALTAGVSNGTFTSIENVRQKLAQSPFIGACHAAAHQAGVELANRYELAEALDLMFPRNQHSPAEPVCGTGVVHGLVQGHAGDQPQRNTLDHIAEQCVRLAEVDQDYATECAHYYGHAVYKNTGNLNEHVAQLCKRIETVLDGWATQSCVSGAAMEKFKLQDRSYNFGESDVPSGPPPEYREIERLCRVYWRSSEHVQGGCHNAAGWLISQRVNLDISLDSPDVTTEEGKEAIIEHYLRGLDYCQHPSCIMGVYTHIRPDLYLHGIGQDLCQNPRSAPWLNPATHQGLCRAILTSRGIEVGATDLDTTQEPR